MQCTAFLFEQPFLDSIPFFQFGLASIFNVFVGSRLTVNPKLSFWLLSVNSKEFISRLEQFCDLVMQ